jgi:hypothetical protein
MSGAKERSLRRIGIALCLVGCGDTDEVFDVCIEQMGTPVALNDSLLFVDGCREEALLLDVSGSTPSADVLRSKITANPLVAVGRGVDGDGAIILAAGDVGDASRESTDAALVIVSEAGEVQTYSLGGSPFDVMSMVDPDFRTTG